MKKGAGGGNAANGVRSLMADTGVYRLSPLNLLTIFLRPGNHAQC